jgi:hypothetical protein
MGRVKKSIMIKCDSFNLRNMASSMWRGKICGWSPRLTYYAHFSDRSNAKRDAWDNVLRVLVVLTMHFKNCGEKVRSGEEDVRSRAAMDEVLEMVGEMSRHIWMASIDGR